MAAETQWQHLMGALWRRNGSSGAAPADAVKRCAVHVGMSPPRPRLPRHVRDPHIMFYAVLVVLFGAVCARQDRCERITLPVCSNLGYNSTAMPNFMDHKDQLQAERAVSTGIFSFLGVMHVESFWDVSREIDEARYRYLSVADAGLSGNGRSGSVMMF